MNPLAPGRMTPQERRAALCKLLALGLVRLRMRDSGRVPAETGDISLHSPPDQCRHATPTHEETT
ncbi:MAG: hypothetical protein CMH11_12810 [Maritimibacter sp.]|nr:hypothetical protein [Maritimibacter sp.]